MSDSKGIIIYGAGQIGQAVLRLAVSRGMPVRGVINREGFKIGQDAGLMAGLPEPLGLPVSPPQELASLALRADIAVVAVSDRLARNMEIYEALLGAGLNVLCAGCEAAYPWAVPGLWADNLDHAARQNGVTFTGSGFQDAYRITFPRMLAGVSGRIHRIRQVSVTDAGRHGAEVARLCHIGVNRQEFQMHIAEERKQASIYRIFLEQAVRAIGLNPVTFDERLRPAVLGEPARCPALGITVLASDCAGTRYLTEIGTEEGVIVSAENELRLLKEGETEHITWTIDGSPPAEVRLSGLDSAFGTASALFRRIPHVIAAEPGIVTSDRMPPLLDLPS